MDLRMQALIGDTNNTHTHTHTHAGHTYTHKHDWQDWHDWQGWHDCYHWLWWLQKINILMQSTWLAWLIFVIMLGSQSCRCMADKMLAISLKKANSKHVQSEWQVQTPTSIDHVDGICTLMPLHMDEWDMHALWQPHWWDHHRVCHGKNSNITPHTMQIKKVECQNASKNLPSHLSLAIVWGVWYSLRPTKGGCVVKSVNGHLGWGTPGGRELTLAS